MGTHSHQRPDRPVDVFARTYARRAEVFPVRVYRHSRRQQALDAPAGPAVYAHVSRLPINDLAGYAHQQPDIVQTDSILDSHLQTHRLASQRRRIKPGRFHRPTAAWGYIGSQDITLAVGVGLYCAGDAYSGSYLQRVPGLVHPDTASAVGVLNVEEVFE